MKILSHKILLILLSATFGFGVSAAYAQDAYSIKEILRSESLYINAKNASGWTLIEESTASYVENAPLRRVGTKILSPYGLVFDVSDITIQKEEQLLGVGNQGEIFFYSKTDDASESKFVFSKVTLENKKKTILYQFSTRKNENLDQSAQIVNNAVGQFAVLLHEKDQSINLHILNGGEINLVPILEASKKFRSFNLATVINDDGRIIVQVVRASKKKDRKGLQKISRLIFSGSFLEKGVSLVEPNLAKIFKKNDNTVVQMVGDILWVQGSSGQFLVDANTFNTIPSTRIKPTSFRTSFGSMGAGGEVPIQTIESNNFGLAVISPEGGNKRYRCRLFDQRFAESASQVYASHSGKLLIATFDNRLLELSPVQGNEAKPEDEIDRCMRVK